MLVLVLPLPLPLLLAASFLLQLVPLSTDCVRTGWRQSCYCRCCCCLLVLFAAAAAATAATVCCLLLLFAAAVDRLRVARLETKLPAGRMGRPSELKGALLLLAS